MGLDHYYTFIEVISFLQKYKQKTIAHNGDNSTNKTNLIYLDDKNMQKIFIGPNNINVFIRRTPQMR